MKQIKIYDYYSFGFNYNLLLSDQTNKTNSQLFPDVKRYLDFIRDLNLIVTVSSIKLLGLIPDLEKLQKLAKSRKTKDEKVDKPFWSGMLGKLRKVDLTLDAELNTKIAYLLDDKRYSNEILLGNIHQLFSKTTFTILPTIAQYDFEESGKCLAYDRYTACAFHSLRGTEDVLKMYYEKILVITPTETDTWGTFETGIVSAISAGAISPEPAEQLIINIRSLRKYYRNPTQHPQNTYTSDEAQDLFSLCIKTVNELIGDLKKRGIC